MVNTTDELRASFDGLDHLPSSQPSPKPERLKKLNNSQVKLTQIQKDLEILIDSMVKNPSFFSRTSNFWGKTPLWQKILGGILLVSTPIIVGIFVQLLLCLVITAFILAIYIGASLLLDDHYRHTQHSTQDIKSGITSLAEGLDLVMKTLEQIAEDLSEQVHLFSKENQQFAEHVNDLGEGNVALTIEIEKLKQTEKKLRLRQEELENTCNELRGSVTQQTQLLEDTQTTLNKLKINLIENEKQLMEKNRELTEIKTQFNSEINKYKKLLETMKEALKEMAETVTKDGAQQELFQQKLTTFLENKDSSVLEIFDRICGAEKELILVKDLLKEETDKYQKLVARTEAQLTRLENIKSSNPQASLLNLHGIYSCPQFEELSDLIHRNNLN